MEHSQTLVWIDLEMTGLDPERDVILEIASIVTDNNLQLIKEGPSLVIHANNAQLAAMHHEVRALHQKSTLVDAVQSSQISMAQARKKRLIS